MIYSKEKKCVIFVGSPGCGKSTYYENNYLNGYARVNLDILTSRNREKKKILELAESGTNMVIDNTNTSIEERKRYFSLLWNSGYKFKAVWFNVPLDVCMERNKNRIKTIPAYLVKYYYKKIEIPTKEEGFEEIIIVED